MEPQSPPPPTRSSSNSDNNPSHCELPAPAAPSASSSFLRQPPGPGDRTASGCGCNSTSARRTRTRKAEAGQRYNDDTMHNQGGSTSTDAREDLDDKTRSLSRSSRDLEGSESEKQHDPPDQEEHAHFPPPSDLSKTDSVAVEADGKPESNPDAEFEGGPLGVRSIIAAWAVTFCTWGYVGSAAIFQSHYETSTLSAYSTSDIAWISSIQLFCVYLTGAFAGNIYDKGYLRHIIAFSCIVSTFGFMMASISTKYWHYILSQGFVTGIGLGSAFTPAVACVSSYYKKRRGFANGMYSSGSAIGGLVIPIFLSKMINNPKIGLAWALRTSGFVCFLFYGVAWLIVRQKKVPTPSKAPLLDFTVFRQRLYCIVVAGFWLQTFGMFYPVVYIQPFGVSLGISKDTVFWSVAILNGASIIGRVAPLIVSDKVGPFNVTTACVAMSCILIYSFAGLKNFGGIAGFSVLNGIAYGCYVTINPVMLAGLSDHPSRIGTHIGMAFLCLSLAALSGPPALGAVVNATGQYWQSALVAGSSVLLATVLLTIGNVKRRQQRGTWRV